MSKIGNNEKCYCGSELKYKKCCKNIVSTVLPPMNVQQAIVHRKALKQVPMMAFRVGPEVT